MSKTYGIRNKKPWERVRGKKSAGERSDIRIAKKEERRKDKQAMNEYARWGKHLS